MGIAAVGDQGLKSPKIQAEVGRQEYFAAGFWPAVEYFFDGSQDFGILAQSLELRHQGPKNHPLN
jgi:hypothetical protein